MNDTADPADAGSAPHLVVEGLVKRFGRATVLSDIGFSLARGEIGVVIGGSGAGKTTLLKILIGLERATAGKVLVGGEDIVPMSDSELNRVRRRFGMVFQYSALLDSMNVLDNVAFPLREHTKLKDKEIRQRVAEKLEILGLSGIEQRFPSQLSGGMKKRVGLARALMLDPELLMYDEPTSGLDPLSARIVDDLIVETRDRFGVTSLVISHDMAGALDVADRIFVLDKGRLAVSGTPSELVRLEGTLANEFIRASGISADRVIAGRAGRHRT